jgi:PAS domain S-box-containing protein
MGKNRPGDSRDGGAGGRSRSATDEGLRITEARFRLFVGGVRDYAIFTLDPTGHVTSWNEGAERIKGYRPEEILGTHFREFYPEEAKARRWPEYELEQAKLTGRFEDEGWRVRKDGTEFWANVVITAVRDEKGELVGFTKVTRDLTDKRRQEEELRESEERFRLMVEAVRDYAIFMLDPTGRVASWNAGAERIKGYRPDEIIGQHFSRFYPPETVAQGWPEYELQQARQTGRFEDEGWRVRKDGSRFWANVVITAVHDRSGELRGFAKVTRDLTEKKRVQRLEEEGRQINEFLAMLGHELRNPLAPIRNAVAVMAAREGGDSTVAWARDLIERQVGHLGRLVDDLLDVSRISSGKITLKREVVDFALVVSKAIEATHVLLEQRRHLLEVDLGRERLPVDADATRLTQVVVNLLTNAAKYTPEGGHVWVRLEHDGDDAMLKVKDDGLGISSDLLPRVFDLFTQGERSLARSEGGLGIGLTMVQRLVELHGGSVAAGSAGPGKGSEFIVRLPLARTTAGPGGATDRSGPAGRAQRRLRVLVVDDNADSAETMAVLLGVWGHEVITASTGTEALELAQRRRPDVVLLDIGLPGIDGYEVARRIRATPELSETVLVAMTGYGQSEDRQRAREAGFTAHLVKPVPPNLLEQLLAGVQPRPGS